MCDSGAMSPMTLSMIACAAIGDASVRSSADMTTSATLISLAASPGTRVERRGGSCACATGLVTRVVRRLCGVIQPSATFDGGGGADGAGCCVGLALSASDAGCCVTGVPLGACAG